MNSPTNLRTNMYIPLAADDRYRPLRRSTNRGNRIPSVQIRRAEITVNNNQLIFHVDVRVRLSQRLRPSCP